MVGSFFGLLLCQVGFFCDSVSNVATWLMPDTQTIEGAYPVASAFDLVGSVLIKRAQDSNWLRLNINEKLYAGDKLQTLSDSKARIEYFGTGASLQMGYDSYFKIHQSPPGFSRFKKRLGMSNSKLMSSNGHPGVSTLAKPTGEGENSLGSQDKVVTNGMTLQKDVTRIPIIEPLGDVVIVTKIMPSVVSIRLESTWSKVGLWAFLWSVSVQKPEPVWVGFSQGSFDAIPLKNFGDYLLQIVTEDEARSSRPIKISIRQRKVNWASLMPIQDALEPMSVEIK